MSKVEIKLDTAGIRALLQSDAVASHVEEIADGIVGRCSGLYTVDQQKGKYRSITRVKTADNETFYRNLHNNELLKAVR